MEAWRYTLLLLTGINNEYRNTIYNTYGVKVAYGEEMGNYLVGNYTPVKMTNPDDINEYLKKIDNEFIVYMNEYDRYKIKINNFELC